MIIAVSRFVVWLLKLPFRLLWWLLRLGFNLTAVVWAVLFAMLLYRPTEIRDRLFRIVVFVFTYATRWILVFLAIWLLKPDVLVGTINGLQTLLQAIPAVVVAVYVLVLASIFVVAELILAAYGTRGALIIVNDSDVQMLVLRPLVVTVGALVFAGMVPDQPEEICDALLAAVTTTALATVAAVVQTSAALPGVLTRYTAPVNFAKLVLADVQRDLELNFTGLVLFKVPLIGEMLRTSIRRGDTPAIRAALEGMRQMYMAYIAALGVNRDARIHTYDDGHASEGWMADLLGQGLVHAGEEALSTASSEIDLDEIAMTLGYIALAAVDSELKDEGIGLIDNLLQLATTVHQVAATGTFNLYAKPVSQLALVEAHAEEHAAAEVAIRALAAWGLAAAYPKFHFGWQREHPLFAVSVDKTFGRNPPFDDAIRMVQSDQWIELWANKQYQGPKPVIDVLRAAKVRHQRRRAVDDTRTDPGDGGDSSGGRRGGRKR